MKISCDFCDVTATGTRDELQMAGWTRAVFSAPTRITMSACPEHTKELIIRFNAVLDRIKGGMIQ